MSTTTGVGTTSAADALTGSANQVTRNTGGSLEKDDFLKLLVGQMKNMDPLGAANSDPSQSMAQMTQYSILEQLTNLSTANQKLLEQQEVTSRIALIGRTVSYSTESGAPAEGVVEQVTTAGGKVSLTIGGVAGIDPKNVLEVR